MSHFLSLAAEVPLGDVIVNDVQAVNISGNECLTASLWITGGNGVCVWCVWCVCLCVCECAFVWVLRCGEVEVRLWVFLL